MCSYRPERKHIQNRRAIDSQIVRFSEKYSNVISSQIVYLIPVKMYYAVCVYVTFEVLPPALMNNSIICDIKYCSPLEVNGHFWETFRLQLQSLKQVKQETRVSLSLLLFLSVFCAVCQCFETLFSVLNTEHNTSRQGNSEEQAHTRETKGRTSMTGRKQQSS
jgi:hypothetical protein